MSALFLICSREFSIGHFRLLSICLLLALSSCTIVGPRTARLAKYGDPVLESTETKGDIEIRMYSLGGKHYRTEMYRRHELVKKTYFWPDGILDFVVTSADGKRIEVKGYHRNGQIRSLIKATEYPRGIYFQESYDERGNRKP